MVSLDAGTDDGKNYAPNTRYANHGFVEVIVRVDTIGSIEHRLDSDHHV